MYWSWMFNINKTREDATRFMFRDQQGVNMEKLLQIEELTNHRPFNNMTPKRLFVLARVFTHLKVCLTNKENWFSFGVVRRVTVWLV